MNFTKDKRHNTANIPEVAPLHVETLCALVYEAKRRIQQQFLYVVAEVRQPKS